MVFVILTDGLVAGGGVATEALAVGEAGEAPRPTITVEAYVIVGGVEPLREEDRPDSTRATERDDRAQVPLIDLQRSRVVTVG